MTKTEIGKLCAVRFESDHRVGLDGGAILYFGIRHLFNYLGRIVVLAIVLTIIIISANSLVRKLNFAVDQGQAAGVVLEGSLAVALGNVAQDPLAEAGADLFPGEVWLVGKTPGIACPLMGFRRHQTR